MRLVPPAWDEAETTGLVHGGYWCPKSSEDSFYEVVSFSNALFYIKASPYYQYFRSGTAAILGPNSVASTGKDKVARTISQRLCPSGIRHSQRSKFLKDAVAKAWTAVLARTKELLARSYPEAWTRGAREHTGH